MNACSRRNGRLISSRLPIFALILTTLLSLFSCGESEQGIAEQMKIAGGENGESSRALKADQWERETQGLESDEILVARIDLAELRGEAVVPEVLVDSFEQLPVGFNLSGNGALRESIKGTLTAQRLVAQGEAGVLREDRYQATGELSPKLWVENGEVKAFLPSKIEAGAEVTFARLFSTEEEALAAPILTPFQIPSTPHKALELSEGTVVQIPLVSKVSFPITGQHLTGSWGRVDQLHRWLKSTAVGFTSAAPQGTAILEGRHVLTITRHEGTLVRVSLQRDRLRRFSGGLALSGGLSERLTLHSAALVDRARSVRDRLFKWARRPSEQLSTWAKRLSVLQGALPAVLAPLLEQSRDEAYPAAVAHLIERAADQVDPVLELLERGELGLEHASAWIEEKVDQTLGRVDRGLNPLFDRVRRYSERAFNINASFSINAEHLHRVGMLGDYLIDLGTEEGVLAYQLMVSGRARWAGLNDDGVKDLNTLDLTVVDGLASEGTASVQRLRTAQLDTRENHVRVNASGPLTSWQHHSGRQRHRLLRIEGDREEDWEAEVWRVDRGWRAAHLSSSEVLLNGQVFRKEGLDHEEVWVYWLSWRRHWPQSASRPVLEAFSEAMNLTGHVGLSHGLPQMFYAESSGALSAQLTLTYSQKLLDALVNQADVELLWSAAAITAAHFDNTFGLPFFPAFRVPELSPEASLACDTIAFHWGRGYCWLVHQELIQPLVALRESDLSPHERRIEQRRWLAELGRRGVLLNPIGSRVIARWIAETAYLLGLDDQIQIQFKLDHPTAPEVSVDVQFESLPSESDSSHQAALDVASWLGIGEGLTLSPSP